MDTPTDPLIERDRKYAWDYFTLHSSQRIATFNFFVTLATAVLAGVGVALTGTVVVPALAIVLGLALALLAFVFWKLDQRNKMLIKNAEEALKEIERRLEADMGGPRVFSLFTRDDEDVHELRRYRGRKAWRKYYSYSNSFNTVFLTFGIFGLVGAALGVIRVIVA